MVAMTIASTLSMKILKKRTGRTAKWMKCCSSMQPLLLAQEVVEQVAGPTA